MRKTLALIAVLCTPPLLAGAQNYAPPAYTFGGFGNGMPGGFPFGLPRGFPGGFPGGFANNYPAPPPTGFVGNGIPGGNRSMFLTMPNVPSNAAAPINAMPPTPYWMQTPPSPQSQQPARYISDVPDAAPVVLRAPVGPSRWAPLPGQAPKAITGNNWALPVLPWQAAPANIPPRWPSL